MSKYFTDKEVRCKCGCGGLPKPEMMQKLDDIREAYDQPLIVVSGYRCPQHNRKIGGAKKSAHVEGKAIDIHDPDGKFYAWIADYLDEFNIWIEDRRDTPGWTHCTIRPTVTGRIFRA